MGDLTAYHGSARRFDQFRPGKFDAKAQLGFGIHFTQKKEFAAKYGRYVYTVRLTYNRMLDAEKVYERGTPEFDLGIELYRGTGQAHMGGHFKAKGVTPICLDCTKPWRAEMVLRKHGFDLVKYNAVVGRLGARIGADGKLERFMTRNDDAPSYVVLDPAQIEILEIEDQGAKTKKLYNPLDLSEQQRRWANSSKEHCLVRMRPVDFLALTGGRLVEEFKESAAPLADYNRSTAEGHTLIPPHLELEIMADGMAIVSGHEGRHRAGALINAGEGSKREMPVFLRIKYWTERWKADVRAKLGQQDSYTNTDYLLGWDNIPDTIYPQFEGGRAVRKSDLEVVEPYVQREARRARGIVQGNPMWGHPAFSGPDASKPQSVIWGFITPADLMIKGSWGGVHNDLARRKKLGTSSQDAVSKGCVRFEIDSHGLLIAEAVKTPDAARRIIALAQRPEVREVALEWSRAEDGATMEFVKKPVGQMILRLRAVARELTPRQRNGPHHENYEVDNPSGPTVEWGWVSPSGKYYIGTKDDKTHDRMAFGRLRLGGWVAALEKGWTRYSIYADNGMLVVHTRATKGNLKTALTLVNRPEVTGQVLVELWGRMGDKPIYREFSTPDEAAWWIRAVEREGLKAATQDREKGNPYPRPAPGGPPSGGNMVFAIFSQPTGKILGTVKGRNREEAMGRVREQLGRFPGHRTSQDILLYPMMNLGPAQRWIATSGIGMVTL